MSNKMFVHDVLNVWSIRLCSFYNFNASIAIYSPIVIYFIITKRLLVKLFRALQVRKDE